MERAFARAGRQAAAADQFQDQAVGTGEVNGLRLPAAFQREVVQPFRVALQGCTFAQPGHRLAEAVVRYVEGQVHATDRMITRRLQFDRAPADVHMIADHALLKYIAEVAGHGTDIGYRQSEVQQAHDRSSVDEPTVAPGHARRPLAQGFGEESHRCIPCLPMGFRPGNRSGA